MKIRTENKQTNVEKYLTYNDNAEQALLSQRQFRSRVFEYCQVGNGACREAWDIVCFFVLCNRH